MSDSNAVLELNTDNYSEEVLESEDPILVDFWAEWCGPCKMLAPVLEEIAEEYEDRLKVGKVNVDENQDLAEKYGIRSIPTLLFISGGEVKEQFVGYLSKDDLSSKLDGLL